MIGEKKKMFLGICGGTTAKFICADTKILALGSHPDDIEIGCGGFIAKSKKSGSKVYLAIMSKCNDQFPEEEKDKLVKEFNKSAKVLGADETFAHDFPNMMFPEHRKEIMDVLTKLQAKLKPTLVLIPFLDDPHQDHSTLAHSAVRTFRSNETILQYEILRHGSHTFTPTLFVNISDYLDTKLKALECYQSQMTSRAYFDRESFKSLAKARGAQSGYDYAEGFVIYKMFW